MMQDITEDEHVIWDQADHFRKQISTTNTECPSSSLSVNLNNNNNSNSSNQDEAKASFGIIQFFNKYCFNLFKLNTDTDNTNNNNNQESPKVQEISSNLKKLITLSQQEKDNLVRNLSPWTSLNHVNADLSCKSSNSFNFSVNDEKKSKKNDDLKNRMTITRQTLELLSNCDDLSTGNTTFIINETFKGLDVNLSDISTCTGTMSPSSSAASDIDHV